MKCIKSLVGLSQVSILVDQIGDTHPANPDGRILLERLTELEAWQNHAREHYEYVATAIDHQLEKR